ncbi:MAG: methyltransferase domain-containing protein [Anaerolineae bacterium]|nr:methyltransferase domain-containing protein [Anaerolineae bacterium]
MHESLLPMLVCPACHGDLTWKVAQRDGAQIEEAEARCTGCGAAYPVQQGIGLFLTPDLPRRDLWEESESRLAAYLREHPEVERQLMETPPEDLAPADLFFRAQVLEERGDFAQARQLERQATERLYTPEYLACHERQLAYVVGQLAGVQGPVVDLASGRGGLVERLASEGQDLVVATDFSPRVLRRNRRVLAHLGLRERVSLLALDARRTPFRDGAIATLTSNLGLANIEGPGTLLRELRRVVSGTFFSISVFYPEEDEANGRVIREFGLEPLLFRQPCLEGFREAGWEVEVVNGCASHALPTPKGVILDGAGIDALPVAETTLEWCTLVAR